MKQSQAARAKKLGIARVKYISQEQDDELFIPRNRDRLELHEVCFLYRHRSDLTQTQVAAELGRCPYWVRQMETGLTNCDELLAFWEQ